MKEVFTMSNYHFETLQLHVGQEQPDPATDSRAVPIYQTTSYVFKNSAHAAARFGLQDAGNIYGRLTNSTQDVLEKRIAALEGGVAALATASGAAAITYTIQALAQAGDHIVAQKTIYGGSFNLLAHTLPAFGVTTTFVNAHDLSEVENAIQPNTKAIYLETLGNPNSDIPDIDAIAEIAHKHGLPVVVDNTFASPVLQHPLSDGADVVVYSTTKYIGGHSDVVGGAVVLNDREIRDEVAFLQNAAGAVPSPFDSWLDIRGLKTLDLRVRQHSRNAMKVAQWLETRPEVERVWYPGLESHPGHEIAARQMHGGFGGMISVQIAAGFEAAKKFAGATEVFTLAESLGGVESLIEHPGAMTHASVAGTTLEVPANLVRLSVGLEDADDLIADLEQAFRRV